MANNPKKVKDPTEVALSAIQEALNISDTTVDPNRNSMGNDVAPPVTSAAPSYSETSFDTRAGAERQAFDQIEEPRAPRRAANDDRETIGQILQAIQKNRPARSVYTLATIFAGVWLVGCGLLTISFLPSLQAATGQSGGVLVLGGLAALFFAPVLLFYFLASLAWRGQEMRMIAQSMAQVAIRFSEPEGAAADSMVTVRRSAAKSPRWATASNARSRAPANSRRWSPMKSQRWSAPIATTKCASAHCCRTSPISATIWSARPSRFAAPFPASRSTCATTSR
jgi:hypothetical protein